MGIGPIVPDLGRHLRDEEDVAAGRRFGRGGGQVLLSGDSSASGSGDAGLIPSIGSSVFGLHGAGAAFEFAFVFGDGVGSVVAGYLDDVVGVGVAAGCGEDGWECLEGVLS